MNFILTMFSFFFVGHSSATPANLSNIEIKIENRTNLQFESTDAFLTRQNETYLSNEASPEIKSLVQQTVLDTIQLIDPTFYFSNIKIQLESEALIKSASYTETIPISVVFTQQLPPENAIRFGTLEVINDPQAFRSILAHEMGHMIMEWVARKNGTAKESDSVLPFWSKSIYEGVADFASACVTGKTLIGSKGAWYSRDILKYQDLDSARNPNPNIADIISNGFSSIGLIPKYRSYVELSETLTDLVKSKAMKDSYAEGTWVAGQLWKLSSECHDKKIWKTLTEFSKRGTAIQDPADFIDQVKKSSGL